MRTIYLVPVGKVEQELLVYLSTRIEKILPRLVEIGKTLPDPDYAYNKKRDQYQSDLILVKLQKLGLEEAEKILGVANLDLYIPGLNFVFGQAIIGGRVALIGLSRLKQGFYGLPENKELYYTRALKEALHELGHTFGLSHCGKRECIMHFSNSLADTDYKESGFCKKCWKKMF